jgi:hypothetical protein
MEQKLIKSLDDFLGGRYLPPTLESFLKSLRNPFTSTLYRGMNYPIHLIKAGNVLEEWHGSTHWSKDFQIAHNFAYDGYINEEYADDFQSCTELLEKYQVTQSEDLFKPVIFRLQKSTQAIDVHSLIQNVQELKTWHKEQEVVFIGVEFEIKSVEYMEGEEPYYLINVEEVDTHKITATKCKWCKGSGVDTEGISMGNPYPCTECKGTGFEHGEEGKRLYYKEMDEAEKKLMR